MIQARHKPYPGSIIEFWRIWGDDTLKAGVAYSYVSPPYTAGATGTEVYVNASLFGFIMLRDGSAGTTESIQVILERLVGVDGNGNNVWSTISTAYTNPASGGSAWGEPVYISLNKSYHAGTFRIRIVCSSPSADRRYYIYVNLEGVSSKPIPQTP